MKVGDLYMGDPADLPLGTVLECSNCSLGGYRKTKEGWIHDFDGTFVNMRLPISVFLPTSAV